MVVSSCRPPLLIGLGLALGSVLSGWFRADAAGWAYTSLAAVFVLWFFRRSYDARTLGVSPRRSLLGAGPYALGFILAAAATLAAWGATGFPGVENVTEGARAATSGELAWILVRIVVVTALLEELIFRGGLWAAFSRCGGPRVALLLSALSFGLWHIGARIHAFRVEDTGISALPILLDIAVTTIFGLALGLLRMRTGGIWAGIVGHAVINGTGAVAYFLATQ